MTDIYSTGITKENIALGVLEQLELIEQDLESLLSSVSKDLRPEVETSKSRLKSLIKLFDDESFSANITASPKLSRIYKTKIERMGLAKQVIRMRTVNHLSYEEIATTLKVAATTISRFCKYYDEQTVAEKAKYQRPSVFDTATQYEDISAMIYRQLARLEDNDAENHVKYVSEMRQLLKQANEFMDKQRQVNQVHEIKEAVVQVLQNALPEQREEIMKQFSLIGLNSMKSVRALNG